MGEKMKDRPTRLEGLEGLAAWDQMSASNSSPVGNGFVKLVDFMGNDLTVVNAARVSFNKRSHSIEERDKKLIKYLIDHEHTSPLRHGFFTFHVKAPIFVLRQWGKHQVGCSWNEVSLRYVKQNMGFWSPSSWRAPPNESIKQGSGEDLEGQQQAHQIYTEAIENAYKSYEALILAGVCNEQARSVLPMASMTEFWWTASLQAVLRFLDLRLAKDSQSEIRDYAQTIEQIVSKHYPATLKAWREYAG